MNVEAILKKQSLSLVIKSIQKCLEFPCKPEEGAVRGGEGRQIVRSERKTVCAQAWLRRHSFQ